MRISDWSSDVCSSDLIMTRIRAWFERHQEAVAPRLMQLQRADLDGAARGIAFQVLEGLGGAPAAAVEALVKDLDEEGRRTLARVGIRLGTESLYIPELLKPRAGRLRAQLWSAATLGRASCGEQGFQE